MSITKWIVSAFGYCKAKWNRTCANWNPDRSVVGKVKCRPALGSTAQKTLAVPQRSYSLSRLASRPGLAGEAGRTSACRSVRQRWRPYRPLFSLVSTKSGYQFAQAFPVNLGGAAVLVNGLPASLVSVSPTRIIAQLPPGVAAGPATVTVQVNGGGSVSSTINVI